jgi:tRNA(Arg) A34 adenosine deaminase TadA
LLTTNNPLFWLIVGALLGTGCDAAEPGQAPVPTGVPRVEAADLPDAERRLHEAHMNRALELARANQGAPFGAVVVDRASNRAVCEGANQTARNRILHAEIIAILECDAALRKGSGELTLYASAEPCAMCAAAAAWAGIDQLVYATSIATLGEFGVAQIHLDSVTIAGATAGLPLASGRIIAGVLAERGDEILRQWARGRGAASN